MILSKNKIEHLFLSFSTMLEERSCSCSEISLDFGDNIIANTVNIRHLKINTPIRHTYNHG